MYNQMNDDYNFNNMSINLIFITYLEVDALK